MLRNGTQQVMLHIVQPDIPDAVAAMVEGGRFPKSFIIPDAITKINDWFFAADDSLYEVFTNNVEEIKARAFTNCYNVIPHLTPKVKKIGAGAFNNDRAWTYRDFSMLTMNKDMAYANEQDYNVYGADFGYNTYMPEGFMSKCIKLDSGYIDLSRITYLGDSSFLGQHRTYLPKFNKVDLSKAIYIGHRAFLYRTGLTEVKFNTSSPFVIGNESFGIYDKGAYDKDKSGLVNLEMSMVKSIGARAFSYQLGLKTVHIGELCEDINGRAFEGCSQKDLTITIDKPQDSIGGAPWGAANATIVWSK